MVLFGINILAVSQISVLKFYFRKGEREKKKGGGKGEGNKHVNCSMRGTIYPARRANV